MHKHVIAMNNLVPSSSANPRTEAHPRSPSSSGNKANIINNKYDVNNNDNKDKNSPNRKRTPSCELTRLPFDDELDLCVDDATVCSKSFWLRIASGFKAANNFGVIMDGVSCTEVKTAVVGQMEVFIISGSLASAIALQLQQIYAQPPEQNHSYFTAFLVLVAASFMTGMATVVFSGIILLSLNAIPVQYAKAYVKHLGYLLLMPQLLMYLSLLLVSVTMVIQGWLIPSNEVGMWIVTGTVTFSLLVIGIVVHIIIERAMAVREAVTEDLIERKKTLKQNRQ